MEAAARSHVPLPPPSRRAKSSRREGGGADRRRRHVPPSRRGGITKRGRRRPHHLLRPCSSQPPNWGAKRARTAASLSISSSEDQQRPGGGSLSPSSCAQIQIQIVPFRGCDDDSKPRKHQVLLLRPCCSIQLPPNYYYYWGAKRARTSNNNWRDWSNLDDGPAGLIAERLLAYDVADYLRFRAVCRPWRQCSTEPRTHSGLDRRFHPRRWVLLREELAAPERRCFLNTSTGECVQVDIPEFHDHELLAVTPEGLLVLVHKPQLTNVRLLNPLTRHLTELPPLTTLLPSEDHDMLEESNGLFDEDFFAWGSGIASDDSTFVLCFNMLHVLGMAKPGDNHWTSLKYRGDSMTVAPVMFEGRFYCVNNDGVMVLETSADQPPRLEVAAKLENINMHVSRIADSLHLVNNCGELMLVHRRRGMTADCKSGCWFHMYRVDLDTGTLFPVKSLGGGAGRAVFIGMYCSLSVSLEAFPSGTVSADTIYLSFDVGERARLEIGAYHLADGSVERPSTYNGDLVPRPHTLVDCLSLSNTV